MKENKFYTLTLSLIVFMLLLTGSAAFANTDIASGGLIIPDAVKAYWMTHTPDINYDTKSFRASIDWSINDSPVKNQGDCGACWAFAALALVENIGGLDDLSEQVVVSCENQSYGCSGGWYGYALAYVGETGVPPEDCYPYTQANGNCSNKCNQPDYNAYLETYDTYGNWGESTASTVNDLKALLQNGPVAISMNVPDDGTFDAYNGGIYNYEGGPIPDDRGHAVLCVAYDDVLQYFKVKNSWGSDWGENGYFKISYDDVTDDVQFGGYACTASGVYTEVPPENPENPEYDCDSADLNSDGVLDRDDIREFRMIERSEFVDWMDNCFIPRAECGDLNEDGQINRDDIIAKRISGREAFQSFIALIEDCPVNVDEDANWGVYNSLCCTSGGELVFDLTMNNETKSSTSYDCEEVSWEGWSGFEINAYSVQWTLSNCASYSGSLSVDFSGSDYTYYLFNNSVDSTGISIDIYGFDIDPFAASANPNLNQGTLIYWQTEPISGLSQLQ